MDRKGWIIIILCVIGLIFNFKMSSERAATDRQIAEQQKQIDDAEKAAKEKVVAELAAQVGSESASSVNDKKEEFYELTATVGDEKIARYTFSNYGGGIKRAEMLGEKKVDVEGSVIINEHGKTVIGALAKSYKDFESTQYERTEASANSVQYRGVLEDGITVTKTWTLESGEKKVAPKLLLSVSFKAAAGKSLDLSDYSLTTGTSVALFEKEQPNLSGWFFYEDGDYSHEESGDFSGGWFSDESPVSTVKVENIEYFGVDNQFFGSAIFPESDAKSTNLWASGEKLEDDRRWVYNVGLELPNKTVNGEETKSLTYDVYVGPKLNKRMSSVSKNSDDIMNFSMFSMFAWISGKMNSALNFIQSWFSSAAFSWGFAIILLTIFIRIVIWPLHNKSTRTMKRMSKLQPIMKDMKEKYKDNPQKLNQETMKLYREYGVNPMGGCLPMLVQIPIFFGVFNMINAAVELRGQPFFWVSDLSQPDRIAEIAGIPINLLPILMAVTMVLQMRMTPQTGDKLQRRIFMLMPLMFFFFCYNYASALALYWTTQNIVSIGQTYLTHRMPEPELQKKSSKPGKDGVVDVESSTPRKKGFMERMAEKMEEIHKEREAAAGNTPAKKQAMPGQKPAKPKKRNPKTGG